MHKCMILFITFLCSTISARANEDTMTTRDYITQHLHEVNSVKKRTSKTWPKSIKTHLFSASVGSLIGLGSGTLSGYLGNRLGTLWLLVHYTVWSVAREKATKRVLQDLESEGHEYYQDIVEAFARAVDWSTVILGVMR